MPPCPAPSTRRASRRRRPASAGTRQSGLRAVRSWICANACAAPSAIELVHGTTRRTPTSVVVRRLMGADALFTACTLPRRRRSRGGARAANILGVIERPRRVPPRWRPQVIVASSGKVHAGHTAAYPITLSTPTSVVCSYGATKLFAEGAAQAFAHDVPDAMVTVIRFAMVPADAGRRRRDARRVDGATAGRRRILVARGRGLLCLCCAACGSDGARRGLCSSSSAQSLPPPGRTPRALRP